MGVKNLKLNYTAFCIVVLRVGILKVIQGNIFTDKKISPGC